MRRRRLRAVSLRSLFELLLVGVVGTMAVPGLRAQSPGTQGEPSSLRPTPSTPTHDLEVTVRTRSVLGEVFCAIWREAEGYPVDHARAVHERSSHDFADRRVQLHFSDVEAGTVAIACFHDENANQTLDTNFLGIPSEGTGASEGARGWLAPPRFEDASFVVSDEGPFELTIRIEY